MSWQAELESALALSRSADWQIVLLVAHDPTQLGGVVERLVDHAPGRFVATSDATTLRRIEPGSTSLFALTARDLHWLNLQRPMIRERALDLLIWATPHLADRLAREAADLFDWIGVRVDLGSEGAEPFEATDDAVLVRDFWLGFPAGLVADQPHARRELADAVGRLVAREAPDFGPLVESAEVERAIAETAAAGLVSEAVRLQLFADMPNPVAPAEVAGTDPPAARLRADLASLAHLDRVAAGRFDPPLVLRWLDEAAALAPTMWLDVLGVAAGRALRRSGGRMMPGLSLAGRWTLLERLGQGGFAEVWKARDRATGADVAVKILHGQWGRERRERLFRGARQMMGLRHPGVVRVLEPAVEWGGRAFFVMEYLPGGDLQDAVRAGRIDRAGALEAICQVAEALAAAHAAGLVHRDVKPSNVLLDGEGRARIGDFAGGTRTVALGTFLFAAPEAMDNAAQVGPLADVYGLGMTAAFVLLGGRLPSELLRHPRAVLDRVSGADAVKVCEFR